MHDFDEIVSNPMMRRAFMTRFGTLCLGAAALGAVSAGCGSGSDNDGPNVYDGNGNTITTTSTGTTSSGLTFFDPTNFPNVPGKSENEVVLNFALTLEYVEAGLYLQALNVASGRDRAQPLDANPASYTRTVGDGGLTADFARQAFDYVVQLAYKERAHATFVRDAIVASGGTPVPERALKNASFGNDLRSIGTFLQNREEIGTRANLGGAPFITDLNLIGTVATLYTTEARHAAALARTLGLPTGPTRRDGDNQVTPNYPSSDTFEYFWTPTQVISDLQQFFA